MTLRTRFRIYLRPKSDRRPMLTNQNPIKPMQRSVAQAVFNCEMMKLDVDIFAARRTLDIQLHGSKI